MSRTPTLILALALALIPAIARAQTPGAPALQAYLGTTAPTQSSQKASFYLWQSGGFDVVEYQVPDASLDGALRGGSIAVDTSAFSKLRTWGFKTDQGDVTVAKTAGVY